MSLLPISIFRNRPTVSLVPINVTITSISQDQAAVTWSGAPAATSISILIYQSPSSPVTTSDPHIATGSSSPVITGGNLGYYFGAVVIAKYTSAISNSVLLVGPAAPTSVIVNNPKTWGAQVYWTAPSITPTSYTVRIYQNSTSTVTTSSSLLVTQTSATSGSSISYSGTNGFWVAATVTAIYSGTPYTSSISASAQQSNFPD